MRHKLILLLLSMVCLGCSRYTSHLPAAEQIEMILFEDLATHLFLGKKESENDDHRMFLAINP
jgi:hypothetical protein